MPEQEMTWTELVQSIFSDASEEIAGYMLWNCTAFPCDTIEGTREQLEKLHVRSGGDIQRAIDISHKDFENEIKAVCEAID